MPVASAWCIDAAPDIERVIASGQMDVVMIARARLADPHYLYRLALELGVEKPSWSTLPAPYAYWLARYRGPWQRCRSMMCSTARLVRAVHQPASKEVQ